MLKLGGWYRLGLALSAVWLVAVTTMVFLPEATPQLATWLRPCNQTRDPLCLFEELNYLRLSALAAVPLFLAWSIGFAVAWVRRGFGDG